jgi:hypothetical protein
LVDGEVLWAKLKARREAILRELGEGQGLEVEYVSPKGAVILIREIGYYSDNDDLVFLVGTDADTDEECQIVAPPYAVQIVFRVTEKGERREIGFHKDKLPGEKEPDS